MRIQAGAWAGGAIVGIAESQHPRRRIRHSFKHWPSNTRPDVSQRAVRLVRRTGGLAPKRSRQDHRVTSHVQPPTADLAGVASQQLLRLEAMAHQVHDRAFERLNGHRCALVRHERPSVHAAWRYRAQGHAQTLKDVLEEAIRDALDVLGHQRQRYRGPNDGGVVRAPPP